MQNTHWTQFFKRAALGLALPLVAVQALAQAGPGKGETLRVVDYNGGGNTLVRVAAAKQYCEKYGIKCVLRQMANGPLGVQAFMAGELEVVHVGSEVVLSAVSHGADIKMVSGGYAPQPFMVAARKGLNLPNAGKGYPAIMADFKGLKIGVPARGGNAETLFTEMLLEAGLTAKDVIFVAVGGPGTAYPPLANKQVDAVMMFSPIDGICEVKKDCDVVLDMRKGEGPKSVRDSIGAGAPMFMGGAYIQQHPEAVKAFRLALADAQVFVRNPANFEELLRITDQYFKMPGDDGPQIVRATMKNSVPGFEVGINTKALQSVIDYMTDNKQLPPGMKAEALTAR